MSFNGETRLISGVLSLEYARVMSLTAVADRNVPARRKLPWNFFTYQVIQIAADTTLLLTTSEAFKQPVGAGAWLIQLGGQSRCWVSGEVTFAVLEFQPSPHTAPDGSQLHLPLRLRWQIREPDGRLVTEIDGLVDTDFVYGVGKGWIGGYSYTGVHEGQPVSGAAYLEYARTR